MNTPKLLARIVANEDINFLLTNRIPRKAITHFMGWFSRLENPWVCRISIAIWRLFTELDLSEARKTSFRSLHDCFTRELRPGARTIDADPGILTSPSDGIVGAFGTVVDGQLLQAKGFPYSLRDLLADDETVSHYRNGTYVTLRLTSSMYHRFHAPCDSRVERVTYIAGDTWNVNPIALRRVAGLFCKNERAVIRCRATSGGHLITLVPVAAILVASIRLRFLDVPLNMKYGGPNVIPCDAGFAKGEEMGWFEHGSTIIVFAPAGFALAGSLRSGMTIRMGQPLLHLPNEARRS